MGRRGRRVGKLEDAGPNIALVCAAYGWTLADVAAMTPAQFQYALEHLPDVEFRRAYPIADLMASVMNVAGGKRDSSEKDADPPKPSHLLWTPWELLPPYARPDWIEEAGAGGISPDAARDFMRNRRRVPSWALQLAPIDAIRRAAEQT